MSKTYMEAQQGDTWNWHEFLANAVKNGVDDKAAIEAYHRASQWVTCAVGNQCDRIPRDDKGGPIDDQLYALGIWFFDHITLRDWREAQKELQRIEKRAGQLLSELDKANE